MTLNFWLRWRFPINLRLRDGFATSILAFDIVQLMRAAVCDWRVGQSFFHSLPGAVATSAVSLPWRRTLLLLGLTLSLRDGAGTLELAIAGPPRTADRTPAALQSRVWAAIAVSAIFVSIYGNRVASEARQLASALNATELILARAQHLSQLDGLAAAAAHELGTPLATVALVVHELAAQPKLRHIALTICDWSKNRWDDVAPSWANYRRRLTWRRIRSRRPRWAT